MASPVKSPVFRVRFESYDDFLVEYGDHLRDGRLVLPRADGLGAGREVRIKLHLPNDQVLYLQGVTRDPEDSLVARAVQDQIQVVLNALSPAQRETLEGCVTGALEQSQSSGDTESGDELQQLNLLLVDDSVAIRIELGDALRERGMRVRVAENGLVAIAAALKRIPDLILCDVEMPVMDGWTFLRMVRARKRLATVPVVFFTRLTDDLSRLQGYRMGVEDYLGKDVGPDEVAARLRAVHMRHARTVQRAAGTQGMRGDLRHVRLGSLLSFLEAERRSGKLFLRRGPDSAVMSLVAGAVADIEDSGALSHLHDQAFALLDWRSGEFEFVQDDALEAAGDTVPVTYLLMEHARRADEAGL